MRQSRARRERRERRRQYEFDLYRWQLSKPEWWQFLARRKWKASKPVYKRRSEDGK